MIAYLVILAGLWLFAGLGAVAMRCHLDPWWRPLSRQGSMKAMRGPES